MTDPSPQFSIVIPTFNRPNQIQACLQSLHAQDFPREQFEVIVVDDGSLTPLEPVVQPFARSLPLRVIRKSNGGPASARNAGAAAAHGRFLAFTDDDCRPARDWLVKLAPRLSAAPDQMVGGRTINLLDQNPYAVTSQIIVDVVYAFFNSDPGQARFLASNNLAMSAEVFRKINGFDTSFPKAAAEDRDLCDRWRHHGFKLTYAPEAVVYHAHDFTFRTFCRQYFNYGRGAKLYHELRGRRGSGQMSSDTKLHTALPKLLRAPLSQLSRRTAVEVAALLVVWEIANAAGFFYEAMTSPRAVRDL
jgi:glycosyltransferase involved in cell wall biosynthesis